VGHTDLLNGLSFDNFNIAEIVKDNYVSLEGINKEDAKKLKEICTSGKLKSQKK